MNALDLLEAVSDDERDEARDDEEEGEGEDLVDENMGQCVGVVGPVANLKGGCSPQQQHRGSFFFCAGITAQLTTWIATSPRAWRTTPRLQ